MPNFGSPFSGLDNERKLNKEELVQAVRFLMAAEYEAIQMYMQLARSIDNKFAQAVLKDVADEEIVHVGELQKLLFHLAPDEKGLYEKGAKEVDDILSKLPEKI